MGLRAGFPVLYVGNDQESEQAKILLREAGFEIEVKQITASHPLAIYGTPVLFGLSNRFEGIDGVRVFIKNATLLGHNKRGTEHVLRAGGF